MLAATVDSVVFYSGVFVCVLACLLCCFRAWFSVHRHSVYFPHVTIFHTDSSSNLSGLTCFLAGGDSGGQLSVLASSKHSRGQNPTLCQSLTVVGWRRPFLCIPVGSWERAMFIKSKQNWFSVSL